MEKEQIHNERGAGRKPLPPDQKKIVWQKRVTAYEKEQLDKLLNELRQQAERD